MFDKLEQATAKPKLWTEYTAETLWTNKHTAKHMLSFHLNPELDLASRNSSFIDKSVDWLVSEFKLNSESKIIDFGCGPGLYTQRFKAKGIGTVVGLDFSSNSLSYAIEQAKNAKLDIEYILGNYLDHKDNRQFDLISLVMCDLCALSPCQRSVLFAKFKTLLAPSGMVALDVYTKTRFAKQVESLSLEKNSMNGFWSEKDYWCITSSFKYSDELVTLDKYAIYEEGSCRVVYNWLTHFTLEMLSNELEKHGLNIKATYADLCGNAFADGDEMAVIISHC